MCRHRGLGESLSSGAWLAGNGFGNFELVIPYDSPAEADFRSVLAVFRGAMLAPEKVLLPSSTLWDDNRWSRTGAFPGCEPSLARDRRGNRSGP